MSGGPRLRAFDSALTWGNLSRAIDNNTRKNNHENELRESGAAAHPGVSGGLGPGECGSTAARSHNALQHEHGRNIHPALADRIPARWPDADYREGRAPL